MTARDLASLGAANPLLLGAWLLGVPALAWLLARLHAPGLGGASPWRWLYALLVYAACLPGVGAAVLTLYTLLFTNENLLDKDLLVYVLPVVSMVATLVLVRRAVPFDLVPGFDRLAGFMVVIAVTFAVLLALRRTSFGIVFLGSLGSLLAVGAAVVALWEWGFHALTRRRGEPARPLPRL